MSSFFEKLKKGMDVNALELEEEFEEKEKTRTVKEMKEAKEEINPIRSNSAERDVDLSTHRISNGVNGLPKKSKRGRPRKQPSVQSQTEEKPSKIAIVDQPQKTEQKESSSVPLSTELQENKESEKESLTKEKGWFEKEGQLVVDVYETEDEIVIVSAIAGVKPENLDISIENDTVLIKGKRERTIEEKIKNYFYQECYWGFFSREIILPNEVDSARTQASMQNGVLIIRIPKIEKEKKRKIIVK